jgi:hypothetical protein
MKKAVFGNSKEAESSLNSVKTFTHAQWDRMTMEEQEEISAGHTIHVCGTPAYPVLPDVRSWDNEAALERWFNLEQPRTVHGMWPFFHHR